jgi:ABC-2 type transport system ATP-binding protein
MNDTNVPKDSYAIKTEGLSKEFDGLLALQRLDLRVRKGTLYGLIGPNGSGKTTLIKILMGLLKPTTGQASVLDESVPLRRNLPKVSYMPQEIATYLDLTVHENLDLFAGLYSLDKTTFQSREHDLLEMTDLTGRRDSLVSTLSGGMKHRVSLACALINDPEVVFLDEPTVGVDPELRVGFWDYFSQLKAGGKTVVMTTHYMDEAVHCDRVGMMRQGELIAEGSPRELLEQTSTTGLEEAFLVFTRGGRT